MKLPIFVCMKRGNNQPLRTVIGTSQIVLEFSYHWPACNWYNFNVMRLSIKMRTSNFQAIKFRMRFRLMQNHCTSFHMCAFHNLNHQNEKHSAIESAISSRYDFSRTPGKENLLIFLCALLTFARSLMGRVSKIYWNYFIKKNKNGARKNAERNPWNHHVALWWKYLKQCSWCFY